jgi:outer membrane protein TolC
VAFYETTARLQANQLLHDSQLSLRNGEISYLEWVVLMNEVFDLRQQELEARWALAQTLIDLESLLTSTNE